MIKIICVGKLKESYLKDGINDYLKRINKYHKIELIEVNDSNLIEEKNEILKYIKNREYIITLEIEGQQLDSVDLSNKIESLFIHYPCITFVIGGSNGIHDEIKKISNYSLSFSKLTFPHGLFRLVILEQIYRSLKIINHETYHK